MTKDVYEMVVQDLSYTQKLSMSQSCFISFNLRIPAVGSFLCENLLFRLTLKSSIESSTMLKQDAKTMRVARLGELFMRLAIPSALMEATNAMTTCTSLTRSP